MLREDGKAARVSAGCVWCGCERVQGTCCVCGKHIGAVPGSRLPLRCMFVHACDMWLGLGRYERAREPTFGELGIVVSVFHLSKLEVSMY